MTPDSWRLIIEAVVVTIGFMGLMALAVWHIVQARQNEPDAIDSLTASNNELARRVRALERSEVTNHESLLRLQTRLELQTAYSRALAEYSRAQAGYAATLADKLRELGQDVPPAPGNPPTPPAELERPIVTPPPTGDDYQASLPAILSTLFNDEELDDLAFRIGAQPDNLKGETLTRRANSLVRWAQARGKLDRLVDVANGLRPEGGIK